MLLSSKYTFIFSPTYQEIIHQTPHVKYKMRCLIKGFAGLLLAVVSLAILGEIASMITN